MAQAHARDKSTGQEVGELPHYHELINFFSEKTKRSMERKTLVHGDFKLDNLVFDKKEARVIGILDWEMVTEGHPLSDLINLTSPYSWSNDKIPMLVELSMTDELREVQEKFRPGSIRGIPNIDECYGWYQEMVGWNPSRDIDWALAFGNFRIAVIMQGIAARLVKGQSTGIRAKEYALQTLTYSLWSLARIRGIKAKQQPSCKL